MDVVLWIMLMIVCVIIDSKRIKKIKKIESDIEHIKKLNRGTYETTRSIEDKLVRYITDK